MLALDSIYSHFVVFEDREVVVFEQHTQVVPS